jgi:hypothetical protein
VAADFIHVAARLDTYGSNFAKIVDGERLGEIGARGHANELVQIVEVPVLPQKRALESSIARVRLAGNNTLGIDHQRFDLGVLEGDCWSEPVDKNMCPAGHWHR